MSIRGVDISDNNGTLNWDIIKEQIDFAIVRVGYGSNYESQDDRQAARNMQELERIGKPYAVYLYSYALNEEEAHSEAAHILRMIAGFNPVLGIYIDMEDADGYKVRNNKDPRTNGEAYTRYCQIVIDDLKAAGFEVVGTYANLDWFSNILDREALTDKKWLAIWGPDSCPVDWAEIWQDSSDGCIDGSSARTDTDVYINEEAFNAYAKINVPEYEPEDPIPERDIEDVGTMYHEGDHVCYNRIYYTAGDWTDGAAPYYTDGVITHVYEGARHPYLIDEGTGFVDDNCITGHYNEPDDTPSEEPEEEAESETEDVAHTTVEPGEGFWQVAERALGDGTRYLELAEFNDMDINTPLYTGMELKLPN